MNILYRACASRENYELNNLELLRKRNVFTKCTVISQTLDDGDRYPLEYYHEIKARYGYHTAYNAICSYDELPAVPKLIWEALLPFKPVIFDMTCRTYHMHMLSYEEMDMLYIKHVRFWNHILEQDQIQFCFFTVVPHTAWEYTIYALAKIKKIPILMIDGHWIPELCSVATDISNLGSSASVCYNKYDAIGMDKVAQAFYDKISGQHLVFTSKEKESALSELNRWVKKCFFRSIPKATAAMVRMKKRLKKGDDPSVSVRTIWNCKVDITLAFRQRFFSRKLASLHYYDKKLAGDVNLNEKYILFSMQYTPEAATLPKAGVFSNQLLTVQLLAEAAKERGIKVYVKEHWSQWKRSEEFYNELSMVPNVYFVESGIGNDILMEHAYMVASQTGTCILESFIRGIPCLIFAYNASADAPGVHYVQSKDDIQKVFDAVDEGNPVDKEDAKKYFAAICKTSVRTSLDWPQKRKYKVQECSSDIVNLITDYVDKGMPDEYYYENSALDIE